VNSTEPKKDVRLQQSTADTQTPIPSGFAEIVSDDFPILHTILPLAGGRCAKAMRAASTQICVNTELLFAEMLGRWVDVAAWFRVPGTFGINASGSATISLHSTTNIDSTFYRHWMNAQSPNLRKSKVEDPIQSISLPTINGSVKWRGLSKNEARLV
jgi:hypothetical protein